MKLKRLRKSKRGKIEIIPMIDIMFFLLATFMLTSLTMHHLDALPINLSQGKAAPLDNHDKITLAIDSKNILFLNEQPVLLEELAEKLKPLLQNENKTVIIASDKNALQGAVTQAMLKARAAGAEHFSIIVKN